MCASHRSTIARKLLMTLHPLFDDTTQRHDTSRPLIVAMQFARSVPLRTRHASQSTRARHTCAVTYGNK
jgi:hypothetical protein